MPIFDPFNTETLTRDAPPRNAMQITPSDTEDLPVLPTYVWAERGDGERLALRVQMGAEAVTLNFPGDGNGLSISPTRIYATGTTASRIILFW